MIKLKFRNRSPQNRNAVYDPTYESMGLPVDPHLRMFLARRDPTGNINVPVIFLLLGMFRFGFIFYVSNAFLFKFNVDAFSFLKFDFQAMRYEK